MLLAIRLDGFDQGDSILSNARWLYEENYCWARDQQYLF